MRIFIPLLFVIISFTSCITYQYYTLGSEDARLNENNEFVVENDTLRIVYSFYGRGGPVQLKVYNKSAEALEIDWRRSSLIIGETPLSFYQPDLKIDGDVNSTRSITFRGTTNSSIDAVVRRPQSMEFIPPHSSITRSGLQLARKPVVQPAQQPHRGAGKPLTVKSSFSKENSPMIVRSYLTFTIPGRGELTFPVEHSFYVSELVQTTAAPGYILPAKEKAGNRFYLSRFGN